MKPHRKVLRLWGPRDFKKMEALVDEIKRHTLPRFKIGEGEEPTDRENWVPLTVTITNHGKPSRRFVRQRRSNNETTFYPGADE